jgi:hypothetical protein
MLSRHFAILVMVGSCDRGRPSVATCVGVAHGSAAPRANAAELAARLASLGEQKIAELRGEPAPCPNPKPVRELELRRRVAAWVRATTSTGVVTLEDDDVRVGCYHPDYVIADVGVDLSLRGGSVRRSWVLRVTDRAIESLATADGPASTVWIEDVVTHDVTTLAESDLDGDGLPDVVIAETTHEIGSPMSHYALRSWLSSKRRLASLVDLEGGCLDATVAPGQLVVSIDALGMGTRSLEYHCLGPRGFFDCAAIASVRARDAARDAAFDAAVALWETTAASLPDHETLARELDVLGMSGRDRAALLAARRELGRVPP